MRTLCRSCRALACAVLIVGFSSELLHGEPNHAFPKHPHNVHVTRGRMVIEGSIAVARIRYFRHDLEAALASFSDYESFSVASTPSSDSLYLDYLNRHFSLIVHADTLRPTIVSSGEDGELWWYDLQFPSSHPINSLTIRNETLLEIFSDQKHFLKVTFFPSGKTESLYFVKGALQYEVAID